MTVENALADLVRAADRRLLDRAIEAGLMKSNGKLISYLERRVNEGKAIKDSHVAFLNERIKTGPLKRGRKPRPRATTETHTKKMLAESLAVRFSDRPEGFLRLRHETLVELFNI